MNEIKNDNSKKEVYLTAGVYFTEAEFLWGHTRLFNTISIKKYRQLLGGNEGIHLCGARKTPFN